MGGYYRPSRRTSRSGHERMLELLLRQGDIAAEGHLRGADIWGRAIGQVGEIGAGAAQQYGQETEKKRQAEAMGRRDAAWTQYVESGEWQKDPKAAYAMSRRIFGPEGERHFQGLMGAAQLMQEKRDPAADQKAAGNILGAMDGIGEDARARFWPQAVSLVKKVYPDLEIPDQYDPRTYAQYSALGPSLRGEKAAEPLRGRPGDVFLDPKDPTKRLAEIPPEPPKPDGPRVVGRSLVGPKGEVIYRDPESRGEGEPLMAVIGDDGQPVYMPRSQAVGRRPASNREQGRPVVSGDARRVADLDTSLDDLDALEGALSGSKATGTSAAIGAALPSFVTEATGIGSEAKQKQATIDRVKQVIGKALEEGVLRKEDELKYEKILPTIKDPSEVVAAKIEGLRRAITQRRQTMLDALSDAGYDVERYRGRKRGGPAQDPLGLRGGSEAQSDPLGLR